MTFFQHDASTRVDNRSSSPGLSELPSSIRRVKALGQASMQLSRMLQIRGKLAAWQRNPQADKSPVRNCSCLCSVSLISTSSAFFPKDQTACAGTTATCPDFYCYRLLARARFISLASMFLYGAAYHPASKPILPDSGKPNILAEENPPGPLEAALSIKTFCIVAKLSAHFVSEAYRLASSGSLSKAQ